jgi:predicted RNase H-like HicB family nuclease
MEKFMMYRVGFPGWKIAARLNVPLLFKIDVVHDSESAVYIATSPDLKGLVVEAATVEELIKEVYSCTDMLMQEALRKPLKHKPAAAWTGDFVAA